MQQSFTTVCPDDCLVRQPPASGDLQIHEGSHEEDHHRALREMEAVLVIGRVFTVIPSVSSTSSVASALWQNA